MALSDQVRTNAEALAKELGHDIQQAFGRFLDDVLEQVTREKAALQAQVDQAVAEAEARAQASVSQAVADGEARLADAVAKAQASAKDESAVAVRTAITQTAKDAAGLVAKAREEAAQAKAALVADRDARRAADEEAAALRRAADEEAAVLRGAAEEAAALRASADKASLAAMERLLEGFRRLDQATTLSGLIDALAEAAAGEATRTGVFVLRGREVRGWRVAGFADAPGDVRSLSVALDAAVGLGESVKARARTEIVPATFAGVPELAFMASGDNATGVALPVTVGGETAAIIYGDDDGAGGPAGWRETLEILARHAARCLEAQTAIRAAKLAPGSRPEAVGVDR